MNEYINEQMNAQCLFERLSKGNKWKWQTVFNFMNAIWLIPAKNMKYSLMSVSIV